MKVSLLNPILKDFIEDLYDEVCDNDIIKCFVNYDKKKYDIKISINIIEKNVSIKKGIKASVHVEGISDFIHFLIENIINYLEYHYADGTTNGIGLKRMLVVEYKKEHQSKIDDINKIINDERILKKTVKRFIIKWNICEGEIDVLIYGVVDDFIWIKKSGYIDI